MKYTFKHVNVQDEQRLLIKLFVANGFSRVSVVHVDFLILLSAFFFFVINLMPKQMQN